MTFPHLQEREKLLDPLGFTGQEAEWITLVCLHSGIFTRGQVKVFLRSSKATVTRFVQGLLEARVSGRHVLADQTTDNRRICRIFGKAIYRALAIPNVRHRRRSSIEVTRRRLLSLNVVLGHPDLPWLPTEQEKVSCFNQLGIDPELLPKRIYAGRANGATRYFHVKMPVAVGQDRAVFVYIDPGMSSRSEIDSWGAAHRQLWDKLRVAGRTVEVVAVAWDQERLDRAQRVLQSWVDSDTGQAKKEAEALRQSIAAADWDTMDLHGGLDAVMEKIHQLTQENPQSPGAGWIDDFRLWGSYTGSTKHETPSQT